jgi:hypothetical protein
MFLYSLFFAFSFSVYTASKFECVSIFRPLSISVF